MSSDREAAGTRPETSQPTRGESRTSHMIRIVARRHDGYWGHNADGTPIGCSVRQWTKEIRPLIKSEEPSRRASLLCTYASDEMIPENFTGISVYCYDRSGAVVHSFETGPTTFIANASGTGRVQAEHLKTRPFIILGDLKGEPQESSWGGRNSRVKLYRAGIYVEVKGGWSAHLTDSKPLEYRTTPKEDPSFSDDHL